MVFFPPLDAPTTMTMIVIGTSAMALAMAFVHPGQHEGIGRWAIGLVAHALTYLLFMQRGHASDWLSIVLANILLAFTAAMLLAAIADFHARTLPRLRMALPIVATGAAMALFMGNYHWRMLASSLILGSQIGLILWALWRPKAPPQRRGALLISISLGLEALILLGRGLWYTVHDAPPEGIMSSGPGQALTSLSTFIVVQVATVGFILMTRERAEAINREMANNDMLTGVPNRRLLLQTIRRDTDRAMREHAPYAVLMADIDHFKAVNDTHGHMAGDAVLRHVAHLLQGRSRGQDMVGRWGGEEFLVLLPATTLHGAEQLAQTLRGSVCDAPCHYEGVTIPVTISIGICADTLQPGDRYHFLIDAADKALYTAKQGGRNRVEHAPLVRVHELRGARPAPAHS